MALILKQDWELELPQYLSEEELLKLLAEKVAAVIAQGPQPFYQLMYRLDISERKLNAITGGGNVAYEVARLVYERQLQKVQSRMDNKTQEVNDDPDLEW